MTGASTRTTMRRTCPTAYELGDTAAMALPRGVGGCSEFARIFFRRVLRNKTAPDRFS
jgi:hypothetical protein